MKNILNILFNIDATMIIKNLYFENSVAKPKIPKGRLSNIFRIKRKLRTFLFFLKNTSGQNIAFVK